MYSLPIFVSTFVKMKKTVIPSFVQHIIPWYLENKRDLPWRNTQDPYAIWISEIILQQTRVQQGMSYYHALLHQFPTVQDLANAPQDQLFRIWQGLGYYSRARNLQLGAQLIADEYQGNFPKSYDEWLQVPGVGPYTAAAVSSFAYDFPKAAVDGNVLRWVSRYLGSKDPIDLPTTKKNIQLLLDDWIQHASPHIFNQASMEFGAILCAPKNPNCGVCPLNEECQAFKNDWVDAIPVKEKKIKTSNLYLYAALVTNKKEQMMLEKRPPQGIWGNLYTLPFLSFDTEVPMEEALAQFKERFPNSNNWKLETPEPIIHLLTHRRMHVYIFSNLLDVMPKNAYKFGSWISKDEAKGLGFPRVFEKFLTHKGHL
jgi:A/G-specific adenine glycosylase